MFSHSKTDDKSLLCLDIGASSIKACVFQKVEKTFELKGYGQVYQQFGNIQSGSLINLSQIICNVQDAVKKAENMAKRSPKEIVVGLSGELVKGMTVTLQHIRQNPHRRIDAQELKTIIYELQWQAFDTIRRGISDEMCINEVDLKLVNASIITIRVNEEIVIDPRGMIGEKVVMEIFNCFSPRQHFGQIQSIAVELPYHELKGVFIQSFAVCHSLSLLNTLESAILIDIGAGTTDVCVVRDGKIVGNRSFSLGGNALTKRISHELSMSFEEAESIKISYCDGHLEKKSEKVIHDALLSDIEIWIASLDFCLKELPIRKLPQKILLCGKASKMKEFSHALNHHDWENHFPINGAMEVRLLDYHDILPGDFPADVLDREFLPMVAVANTAYDLLYTNDSVESILNSIIADKEL